MLGEPPLMKDIGVLAAAIYLPEQNVVRMSPRNEKTDMFLRQSPSTAFAQVALPK
jgi:hypothetical protein